MSTTKQKIVMMQMWGDLHRPQPLLAYPAGQEPFFHGGTKSIEDVLRKVGEPFEFTYPDEDE